MTSVDISSLVEDKTSELMGRPPTDGWAACASIWARVLVLATPGWTRWPDLYPMVGSAFTMALDRCTGFGLSVSPEERIARLNEFDIEDDGSAEWQYVIDVIAMLLPALQGDELETCVRTTISTYLEETFTVLANELASTDGRPISQTDAKTRLAEDERWRRAVQLVLSL